MNIICLIVARNESKHIGNTIKSIKSQSIKINHIILVDDGSTDATPYIANRLGCCVIQLPYHKINYVGRPELSLRWNRGLRFIKLIGIPDYVLLMGADHVLNDDYVEIIINGIKDSKIKIASGIIENIGYAGRLPLGSGRIIDARFWDRIGNFKYPFSYGWESWLLYKAELLGFKLKVFDNAVSLGRPIKMNKEKAFCWGKASYTLGCSLIFMVIRCLLFSRLYNPVIGLYMLKGFIDAHGNENRLDVSNYVSRIQVKNLLRLVDLSRAKGRSPPREGQNSNEFTMI